MIARTLLVITLLSSMPAWALDQQALMKVFFSVVLVRGFDETGNLAYGTGVVVADNQVATNCHVLRKTGKAWVSQGEDAYQIESVQADPHHDLCLLNFSNLPFKPVGIGSTQTLIKGEEVISMGHSNGVPAPITSVGQVKALYPLDSGNVVRTSARFMLGASGSPMFDGNGRLIGFNTFKTPGRHAFYYATPVEWLEIARKSTAKTEMPITGRTFWELPDEEKPYFMQVALPHLNEDWNKLESISQQWIKSYPDNPEAWFELALAQEGQGRKVEAEAAYKKVVAMDATHAEAYYRLGLIASQRGDHAATQNISTRLAQIDGVLAEEFNKAVGCAAQC